MVLTHNRIFFSTAHKTQYFDQINEKGAHYWNQEMHKKERYKKYWFIQIRKSIEDHHIHLKILFWLWYTKHHIITNKCAMVILLIDLEMWNTKYLTGNILHINDRKWSTIQLLFKAGVNLTNSLPYNQKIK